MQPHLAWKSTTVPASKKVQRRPNKARNRGPRPASQPVSRPAVDTAISEAPVPEAAPLPRPTQPQPTRRAPTARRPPVTTINYDYLRHDLRMLGMLAPAMVILVVLAFLFIH
jgi:hypothetical protein